MKPDNRQYDYFIASHVLTDGPGQALRDYLVTRNNRVAFAGCPFADADIPAAEVTCYQAGKKTGLYSGHKHNKLKGIWLWLLDAGFVWKWGSHLSHSRTIFVGINNLNAVVGIWLKRFGRCGKVIYYVIDYTPQRFKSNILNSIYQALARFAARNADQVWNLSERMRAVHKGFGTKDDCNILVPVGLDQTALKVLPDESIERNRLVVVSTLYPNKGVQLAIEALVDLPQAQLVIVGTGPYRKALQTLANKLGVASRIDFLGMVSRQRLFAEIAKSRLAIAAYVPEKTSYSFYADPAKPKEYLACGVPVVITRVPWIAAVIAERPMGIAIDYNKDQLAAACRKLLSDDAFWKKCRQAALAFSQCASWDIIFDAAWKQLLAEKAPAHYE